MASKIGRIEKEFILKNIDDGKIEIELHSDQKESSVVILNIEVDEYIEVFSKDRNLLNFEKNDKLRCYFAYYGNVMTFYSKIISCNEEKAKIAYPELFLRNLQRKNERVEPVDGLALKFKIENYLLELDYPKTSRYVPIEDFSNIEKISNANIKELIINFRKIISNVCDESEIILFKERKPLTFEEKIISQKGEVFYIPSIYEAMNYPETSIEIPFISTEDIDPEKIAKYIYDMKNKDLYSVLYCPILYHEYIVGYICLLNKKHKKITVDTLEYVYQFTKIIVWMFAKNDFFEDKEKKSKMFSPKIINISESGILFADSSRGLSEILQVYTDLKLELIADKKVINIPSRIMRRYSSKDYVFYGVKFLDFPSEDFEYLFEFIYGRKFTERDTLWEGGATPPTLEA